MPIEFTERLLPDGRLTFNWQAPTPRDWQRILTLVKNMIPVNGRTFLKDEKVWLIAAQYRPVYEEIKTIVLNGDPESLDDIDQQINDEALVELVDRDILKLPASMRRRAFFAVKATVGLIDTPVEFCVSEGIFGAWNPDEEVWCYENGRYSRFSPTERDNKAREAAYKRVARIVKQFESQLETIDEISELYWKVKFRAGKLAR